MNELDIKFSASEPLRELALFAGCGGGILGGHLLGWKTICAVEIGAWPAAVLAQRQNDGILPPFPIWDDVCTFDGAPWSGIVDIVSGGFPCQDISVAGKGEGITGERSGLWKEMWRIVREVGPQFVYVENSPALTSRGLGIVIGDLARVGYCCRWGMLSAGDIGAWHERKRIWIFAYADRVRQLQQKRSERNERRRTSNGCKKNGNSLCSRLSGIGAIKTGEDRKQSRGLLTATNWWASERGLVRMVHGVPGRVDRIKALGNSQVPCVAASAFRILSGI